MQVTIAALLGVAATFYLRRLIMASQLENQKRIDALEASLEASEVRQTKAHDEILEAVAELREQAAAGNQELDFTKVEGVAGRLASGAQKLDDLNEDKPAVEVPPVVEPETEPAAPANPVADGASVDGAPEA